MDLRVLNTSFQPVDIVDTFESLIWTDRYNKEGQFELYLPVNKRVLNIVRSEYYLQTKYSEHTMIVEGTLIKTFDEDEGDHVIITGRSLESILDRRIVWGLTVLEGNLQEGIKKLINENIINPSVTERKIANFIFQDSTDPLITSLEIETQYNGEDLLSVLTEVCECYKIGFKIVLNDDNQFVFSLFAGVDRSYNQDTNDFVIFSPSFDNLSNCSFMQSIKPYKNVTLIGGEGEGEDQTTAVIGEGSGLNRREIYTDASSTSSSTSEYLISQAEYQAELQQKGKENLAENKKEHAFEGDVDSTSGVFIYRQNYFVGDKVQLVDDYGYEACCTVSEFVITQDDTGVSMIPTFEAVDED